MSAEQATSQSTITSAVPILGGGAAITAVSNTFDGTLSRVALLCGVVLILTGAMIFGIGLRQRKAEQAES